jgi:uncharacterized protein YbjQ (UPF0145 family)
MVANEEIKRRLEEKRRGIESTNDTKKICPSCETKFPESSKFCGECGNELETISEEKILSKKVYDDLMIVSSNFVPGYKAIETLGFVYGLTVRSRGLGGQIGAGIRSMFGGEIKEYVKMMQDTRNEALNRMVKHANEMGANAIISVRFDSDEISDIMQEILAYGTAVVVEKE